MHGVRCSLECFCRMSGGFRRRSRYRRVCGLTSLCFLTVPKKTLQCGKHFYRWAMIFPHLPYRRPGLCFLPASA